MSLLWLSIKENDGKKFYNFDFRKVLPNGEEAGLGIIPSKQRWERKQVGPQGWVRPVACTINII
jgi:hypothetical protein